MCFFYALSKEAQKLKNRMQIKFDFEFEPVFYTSGFDYPQMPVVTNQEPDRLQMLNWGLIPPWTKPEEASKMRSYTLNARNDSLFVKPSFRNTIRQKRCLVPATGFYEWREFAGKKYPYFIYLKKQEIFNFAGLWEEWVDRSTGEMIKTYSIITTEANRMMSKIHNTKRRMPVILPESVEQNWLCPDLSIEEILSMTRPLDDSFMAAHTISRLITSKNGQRNVPAIQNEFRYPELTEL